MIHGPTDLPPAKLIGSDGLGNGASGVGTRGGTAGGTLLLKSDGLRP